MPDSLPPYGWGFASFDDRDLDAVLDGETADIPVLLRPVAEALATLRAAPAPAELSGEENAMAEFRALGLGHPWHPAGLAQTLLLEAPPAAPPRPRAARPRRRGTGKPASWRAGTLMSLAAAAAFVLAMVFTGNFSGPIHSLANLARTPAPTGSPSQSSSPREDSPSATREPTAPPSATRPAAPAQSPVSTCRAYYGYFLHPAPPSSLAAEERLWEQLTKLAGHRDWFQMWRFCAPYVSDLAPKWTPVMNQYPPVTHSGTGAPNNGYPGSQAGPASGKQSSVTNSPAANPASGPGNGAPNGPGSGSASGFGN